MNDGVEMNEQVSEPGASDDDFEKRANQRSLQTAIETWRKNRISKLRNQLRGKKRWFDPSEEKNFYNNWLDQIDFEEENGKDAHPEYYKRNANTRKYHRFFKRSI